MKGRRFVRSNHSCLWVVFLMFLVRSLCRPAQAFCPTRQALSWTATIANTQPPVRVQLPLAATVTTTATTTRKALVIVESPAKCATIETILNNNPNNPNNDTHYTVLSCYGHVRNLKAKTPKSSRTKTSNTHFPYHIHGIHLEDGDDNDHHTVHRYQPIYEILPDKQPILQLLQQQASISDTVYLATDADREGEAMAWHLTQVLELPNNHKRLRLTELTPSALWRAVGDNDTTTNSTTTSSSIDTNLVAAQETRRLLDRLVGYTVCPVLWKKIGGGLSAGRVQGVGLQSLVVREVQRLQFISTTYWDLVAGLRQQENNNNDDDDPSLFFTAQLHAIQGQVVARSGKDFTSVGQQLVASSQHKLHIASEQQANAFVQRMRHETVLWKISSLESRQRQVQPPLPYKTSTLQRDAVSKLGWSVDQTMRMAQTLYETGHISYMRTDSTSMSVEAKEAMQLSVSNVFGAHSVASGSKKQNNKQKAKHSQEAHEAIRPALQPDGTFCHPDQLEGMERGNPLLELYRLIYQRTLAYGMLPLVTNQTQVIIQATHSDDGMVMEFRASGSVVLSPGYTAVYEKTNTSGSQQTLPDSLQPGQVLDLSALRAVSHETQPPPRFTEATFVKELEDLGVGRPSTYAGTVRILRQRAYVVGGGSTTSRSQTSVSGSAKSALRAAGGPQVALEGGGGARGPMIPTLSAFCVSNFLKTNCPNFVDPAFTARMEEQLDEIAAGNPNATGAEQRVAYLDDFYAGESGLAAKMKHVEDFVDGAVARRVMLPSLEKSKERIGLFVGHYGPYVRELTESDKEDENLPSAALPPALAADIASITPETLKELLKIKRSGGHILGFHPDDGRVIRLKTGRYGAYLQWGEDDDEQFSTHSIPRELSRHVSVTPEGVSGITLEDAVGYCNLPRTVCALKDLPIVASIGPYGPYLKYNNTFTSLHKRDGDVLTIDPETAERLVIENIIEKKNKLGRGVLASLGEKDGNLVTVKSGRYGAYLNWKKVNAPLPDEHKDDPESISLEDAWPLIQAKLEAGGTKTKVKKAPKQDKVDFPPKPKRPLSAYLHFCAEKRPEVAETASTLGEISKELSRLWKLIDIESRKPFEEMATASKQEYLLKQAEWEKEVEKVKNSASRRPKGAKKPKKASQQDEPKRPKSAYLFFCAEQRPKVAETVSTLGDITKELARRWAETTDRSEYEDAAAADKKRYSEELARFKHENDLAVPQSPRKLNGQASKKKKTKSKTQSRRAPSAYMLFCQEQRPLLLESTGGKLSFGETTKRLAELWRECDEPTRALFQEIASKEKEKLMTTLV